MAGWFRPFGRIFDEKCGLAASRLGSRKVCRLAEAAAIPAAARPALQSNFEIWGLNRLKCSRDTYSRGEVFYATLLKSH